MFYSRNRTAEFAFDKGKTLELDGNLLSAHQFYEYAQRLAPADSEITLAIGLIRLRLGDPRATEALEQVAQHDNIRESWIGLAAVQHMIGQPKLAALQLGLALMRHTPTIGAGTLTLQDIIAQNANAAGWCALSNAGLLTIYLTHPSDMESLSVCLDDVPIALPNHDLLNAATGRFTVTLPLGWQTGSALDVFCAQGSLIGSPIQIAALTRVEGFVTTTSGGLDGWAWMPGDIETCAEVIVCDYTAWKNPNSNFNVNPLRFKAADESVQIEHTNLFARPRRFHVPASEIENFSGAVSVLGADGQHLYGSPLDPGAERRSAEALAALMHIRFSITALPDATILAHVAQLSPSARNSELIGAAPVTFDAPVAGVDVIIPVYRGLDETLACIQSVLAVADETTRVVVIEDRSPDIALVKALEEMAAAGRIVLHRQPQNRGFPASVNIGLLASGHRDVILLNSDTLVPPNWLERLRQAAYSSQDIGTATPISNDATILSYPHNNRSNDAPTMDHLISIDLLASKVNEGIIVDIPTAIGFCMYIRRDCLKAVGLFRDDVFAQGYGEENDFCIRARHLGWRHIAVPSVYVAHIGGHSFGPAKQHLLRRNMEILNRLHPGYDRLISDWQASDPLAPARRNLDLARWQAGRNEAGAVIILTHNRAGGVKRRVLERCQEIRAMGLRPIVLYPAKSSQDVSLCQVDEGQENGFPNLRYMIPPEIDVLLDLLRSDCPRWVEIHHFIGHDDAMLTLALKLDIPYDIIVHDYSWFCPRIDLMGVGDRYCGEPDLPTCENCISTLGSKIESSIRPTDLVVRSTKNFDEARRVIVPSGDTARRLRRHFPNVHPLTMPWESDVVFQKTTQRQNYNEKTRICVVGAIGTAKGYDYLLACASDAAERQLPLEFILVGYSSDDIRLIDTGMVTITGPYNEAEAVGLIVAQNADFGFLSSVWPETWSYVLTLMWKAGLPVFAFDLGAVTERLNSNGAGCLLPLGLPPSMLNDIFVKQRMPSQY